MKRILNPATNPAGYSAALALAYALAQAVLNVHAQHKALSAPVVVAVAGGVLSWWIRNRVTPVADPRDGSGNPLTPPPVMTAEQRMLAAAAAAAPQPGLTLSPGLALTEEERDVIKRMFAALHVVPAGRPLDVTATYATGVTNPKPPADPLRNTGYTGGMPASEMPPPPTDVPSVALLPPAVQPPATTTGPAT